MAYSGPDSSKARLSKAGLFPSGADPKLANPRLANPRLAKPRLANPKLANPKLANPGAANPGAANPGAANPGVANPGLAQARPHEDARPLSRPEAEALIGHRLAALGHAPGFFSAEAMEEIIARGAGSARRIRHALSATLFLASTEDLPCVGAEHVCRAVPAEPAAPLKAEPGARSPLSVTAAGRPARFPALLPALLAGALLAPVAVTDPPPPSPMPVAVQREVIPTHTRTLPARKLPRTAAPAVEAQTPAIEVPVAQSLPQDLPLAPPATVVLLLPRGREADQGRLAAIRQALGAAGFTDVEEAQMTRSGGCRGVCYFYAEDAVLATRLAGIIAAATNTHMAQNPRPPMLFSQSPDRTSQPPGSVDITVW
jgi:hypothetical protein